MKTETLSVDQTQKYKWVFTHNSPEAGELNEMKEIYDLYAEAFRQNESIKDATFQIEAGVETQRPHIQGRVHFLNKRTKGGVLNLFRELVGDIKQVTVNPEIDASASIAYCSKASTRVPDTVPFHKLKKAPCYSGSDVACLDNQLRDWQKQMLDILNTKPYNTRHIYWIYCKEGNSGKSLFLKWLQYKDTYTIGEISDAGTASQMKATAYNLGRKQAYFVDLPRTRSDVLEDIMRVVENIKNGKLSTTLYGGGEVILMDPPLVVVFSNYLPDINWFSRDRWKIYKINEAFGMVPLSLASVEAAEKARKAKKIKK